MKKTILLLLAAITVISCTHKPNGVKCTCYKQNIDSTFNLQDSSVGGAASDLACSNMHGKSKNDSTYGMCHGSNW